MCCHEKQKNKWALLDVWTCSVETLLDFKMGRLEWMVNAIRLYDVYFHRRRDAMKITMIFVFLIFIWNYLISTNKHMNSWTKNRRNEKKRSANESYFVLWLLKIGYFYERKKQTYDEITENELEEFRSQVNSEKKVNRIALGTRKKKEWHCAPHSFVTESIRANSIMYFL